MEKSKSALRISIMIMALMALFSLNAFADSSWVWISEKRPFDILPWVALGTILIEWLSIWLIPKTGHALKVLGIVMIANAASFLLPYVFLKTDFSWYGTFEDILDSGPHYSVKLEITMDTIITFYNDSIGSFLPKEIFLIILSTLPFIELRGGMIAASLLKIPYLQAVLLCLAGNTIPIPFVLVLGRRILQFLKRNQTTAFLGKAIEDKVAMKSAMVKKYEFMGLLFFVGIPIPGSGIWSGSLIASLLDFSVKRAVCAQVMGLILCISIMSFLTYVFPNLFF